MIVNDWDGGSQQNQQNRGRGDWLKSAGASAGLVLNLILASVPSRGILEDGCYACYLGVPAQVGVWSCWNVCELEVQRVINHL